MKIRFGDRTLILDKLEDEKYIESCFTGNKLHCFSKSFTVNEENTEWFNDILDECTDGGVFELGQNDKKIKEYKVMRNSSYSVNSSYTYNLYFEQIEKLDIEKLQLGNLVLEPYKYFEEHNDGIVIEARVNLSSDEWNTIIQMDEESEYFNVIRHGINENPINMRFGKNIWSENNKNIKARIVLVEDKEDDGKKIEGINEPELTNIKNKLINLESSYNELLELLCRKNIINDKDKKDIKTNVKEKFNKKYDELYRVNDVDEYLDK